MTFLSQIKGQLLWCHNMSTTCHWIVQGFSPVCCFVNELFSISQYEKKQVCVDELRAKLQLWKCPLKDDALTSIFLNTMYSKEPSVFFFFDQKEPSVSWAAFIVIHGLVVRGLEPLLMKKENQERLHLLGIFVAF